MKEIAINACYGGFSLSKLAINLYLHKSGKECHFYEGVPGGPYHKINIKDVNEKSFFVYSYTKDHGDILIEHLDDGSYFCDRDVERDDPNLIKAIKELKDEANGMCAKLKVVEIPDEIKYEIVEYDGFEHVAEVHRTWS